MIIMSSVVYISAIFFPEIKILTDASPLTDVRLNSNLDSDRHYWMSHEKPVSVETVWAELRSLSSCGPFKQRFLRRDGVDFLVLFSFFSGLKTEPSANSRSDNSPPVDDAAPVSCSAATVSSTNSSIPLTEAGTSDWSPPELEAP